MPTRSRLRRAALLAPLAGALIGLACSAPPPKAPACPSVAWCGKVDRVEPLRQTREGALRCPKYVAWGQDGGAAPAANLPTPGEASLDLEPTRKRRAAGESEACCYRFYPTCPAAKR